MKRSMILKARLPLQSSSSSGFPLQSTCSHSLICLSLWLTWLQAERTSQWPQRLSWQVWVTLGRGRWLQRSRGTEEPPPPNSCRHRSWRCWVPGPQERLQEVHSPASQLWSQMWEDRGRTGMAKTWERGKGRVRHRWSKRCLGMREF